MSLSFRGKVHLFLWLHRMDHWVCCNDSHDTLSQTKQEKRDKWNMTSYGLLLVLFCIKLECILFFLFFEYIYCISVLTLKHHRTILSSVQCCEDVWLYQMPCEWEPSHSWIDCTFERREWRYSPFIFSSFPSLCERNTSCFSKIPLSIFVCRHIHITC